MGWRRIIPVLLRRGSLSSRSHGSAAATSTASSSSPSVARCMSSLSHSQQSILSMDPLRRGTARCRFMILPAHINENSVQQLLQQMGIFTSRSPVLSPADASEQPVPSPLTMVPSNAGGKTGTVKKAAEARTAQAILKKIKQVCIGRMPHLITQRQFSSDSIHNDKMPYEEETERKVGWLIKLIAAATLTYVGFNFFPLMGDTVIRHSVALLRTKDPFFKRSGASRLTLIATNDERRKSIVEAGGIEGLFKMLESASDDKTRYEAVKALEALSHSDLAVEALHSMGAEDLVQSLAMSSFDLDIQKHSSLVLQRLDKLKQGRNE